MTVDAPTDELTGDLVVFQRNRVSGSGRHRQLLKDLIWELKRREFLVRLFADRNRLDHFVRAVLPADRLRCLVAAGGDGTISSLVSRHPQQAVIPLPMGTENLVARHLNITRQAVEVAERIQTGRPSVMDTADVGSVRFLLMASAGIDAAVVDRLHAVRSGNIRRWNYVAPIFRTFAAWRSPQMEIRCLESDRIVQGTHVVVANLPEYGFALKLTPDADPCDGLLDVRVYQGCSVWKLACHALATRWKLESHRRIVRFRTRQVRISALPTDSSGDRIPVQADGDPAGWLPVDIRVNPGAMRLIVPGTLRQDPHVSNRPGSFS